MYMFLLEEKVKRYNLSSILVLLGVIIFQSTLLNKMEIFDTKPDLVLIVIVIFSNCFGSLKGELFGAASGLVEDFITLSPLGFNTFVRTLTGYLAGVTRGKIFLDPIVTPVILVIVFTIFRAVTSYLLLIIFEFDSSSMVFTSTFIIHIIMNIIFTPFILLFLKLTKLVPTHENKIF